MSLFCIKLDSLFASKQKGFHKKQGAKKQINRKAKWFYALSLNPKKHLFLYSTSGQFVLHLCL